MREPYTVVKNKCRELAKEYMDCSWFCGTKPVYYEDTGWTLVITAQRGAEVDIPETFQGVRVRVERLGYH